MWEECGDVWQSWDHPITAEKLCLDRKLLSSQGLDDCGGAMTVTHSTTFLQRQYFFRAGDSVDRPRAWSQLADFQAAIYPVLQTVQKFPFTFWALPVPFDTQQKATDWQIRLECCSLFLGLIRDTKLVQLEAVLLAFYWPEIQQDRGLLDYVSTSNISSSRRDRVKRLVRAWLLLDSLSFPIQGIKPPHAQAMPDHLFYRFVRVYRVLQTWAPKSLPKNRYLARFCDVCGGSDTSDSFPISCVLACTGEEVCRLEVTDSCTILDLKMHIAGILRHLPFAVSLLLEGRALSFGAVWAVIGFPPPPVLHVVLIPRRTDYKLHLSDAVQQQEHDAIIRILSAGQDPDCSGIVRRTGRRERVLLTAAAGGFFYSVHLLLSALADPSTVGNDSRSALHIAVLKDSPMTLCLLLNSKADVHASDLGGETPLHYAASCDNARLVRQLVQAGADPLALDSKEICPLLCSCGARAKSSLMDGCWDRLSFATVILLNMNLLSAYKVCDELARVSRNMRHCAHRDAMGGSSHQDLLQQVQANKEGARARKMQRVVTWTVTGLELPIRGDAADALVPLNYEHFASCQDISTLAWLHPHSRDRHVRFEQEDHVYFVRGKKTQGSVTGLIHTFARAFDADAIIHGMMTGDRWPRENYLRPCMPEAVLQRVRQVDPALVLALLDVPRNDPWICGRIQILRQHFPDLCDLVTLNPEEIKKMWSANACQAAACGTYMHYLFEAHVNGYAVPQYSPEFAMLKKFLRGMHGWRAYRTEWTIFGEEEDLAGSIDFCAIDANGCLAIIDWKRSARLEAKYTSPSTMLPPLAHLPDCAGWHYRLQLNAYRYLIEKYYQYRVSKMLIVGVHPDRQLEPFVDDVPRMERETEMLMKIWRGRKVDVCGGAAIDHDQDRFAANEIAVTLDICSAITAEPIASCTLNPFQQRHSSLTHIVRREVAIACDVPYFGVQIVQDMACLGSAITWEACGSPNPVTIVKKPLTASWTKELFAAIEEDEVDCIYQILQEGQNPNCVYKSETALSRAVLLDNPEIVGCLIQAGADCDFIPARQRHAPSHLAASLSTTTCLELLLLSQADPNLPDQGGLLPIHHAMMHASTRQQRMVELLVSCGADVLRKDCDGDSAFSLAPPGACTAICVDHCWPCLSMVDLLQRHAEELVQYTQCGNLWATCVTLHQRSVYFADVRGGALDSSMPSEVTAALEAEPVDQPCESQPAVVDMQVKEEGHEDPGPCDVGDVRGSGAGTSGCDRDSLGGSELVDFPAEGEVKLEVRSAITADLVSVCTLDVRNATLVSLAHIVRSAVSRSFDLPYFGIDVMIGNDCCDDVASWMDCGSPNPVHIVRKARSLAWTEDLFTAIWNREIAHTRRILSWGQDPNCMLQNSALIHAVVHQNIGAVAMLLKGGAHVDLIPAGCLQAASHTAANQGDAVILRILLAARSDPNLQDKEGLRPIHHAVCALRVSERNRFQTLQILTEYGADVLLKDEDGDSGFSLATSGPCLAACIDQCWSRLSMMDVLMRHMEELVRLCRCHALWSTCKVMRRQALFFSDVLGGALDSSQPSQFRELSQELADAPEAAPEAQPCETQPAAAETQVKEEDYEDPDQCDDGDDPLLASVKKRRLMKGAQTTRSEFEDMFRQYHEWNEGLVHEDKDTAGTTDTILARVCELRQTVVDKYPAWSERMVRIGAAALATYRARLSDRLFMGDNAFFLWLVEGDRFIRIHDGFCYIYNDNGAFMPYSGIPPQAVLVRLALFFSQLEGVFRRMDPGTRRNDVDILASVAADRAHFPDEESFLQACQEAAIWQQTSAPPRDPLGEDAEEAEADVPRGNKPAEDWPVALGKRIWKVCQSIRNELMHEKLIALLVEWCETPRSQKPCVSYHDTCVQYDVSREVNLRHIPKAAGNDCYVFIPHPLLDPVLQQHQNRLEKFYQQTFWANNDVFQCNMAAMALAKRGFNVDRCFIGESPGGVGQSLFSLHIDAMLGPNHGYFDPNVWYNEDELRKQVESFARCIVVTGQEAPESHKRLHLDLFKKTMSGDGIAGRKPYGYTTRMFSVVGWKRLEVNRMMVFAGINKSNFQSVMRRALVWKPKARFHPESVLKQAHTDHEEDGHFLADPTLKQFLASPGASAAGLRIQHAFELQRSQHECMSLIEDYATGGDGFLTEDKMRKACGIELRVRHEETAMGGVGLLHVSDSQEERDQEDLQYTELRDFIVKNLLVESCSDITLWEFKKVFAQSSNKPNASHQTAFKELKTRKLMQKGCRKGKAKDVLQPVLSCEVRFEDIIFSQRADEERVFPETMNTGQIRKYLDENPCRNNNVSVMKQFFTECFTEKRLKKGRRAADDNAKIQSLQDQLCKLENYEAVCQSLADIGCPEAASTPRRRSTFKQPGPVASPSGLVETSVRYKYSGDRKLRGRRYATQTSAQKCARRIQTQLFDHTIDLDIENCCATLALQLVDKLKPNPPMPEEAREALRRWTDSRRLVCREELKVSDSLGKKIVTAWLSGGTPDKSFKDIPFVKSIQRASIYLRWLACSVLAEDYEELEMRSDKPYPGATAFFYMWSGVEDTVLEAWCDFLLLKRPTHLSLHFDGVRVNADVVQDIDVLISDCQDKIKERTGFSVRIRQKTHKHFMEVVASLDSIALDNIPSDLLKVPNCIPCALWHLAANQDKDNYLQAFLHLDAPQNAFAVERKYRTYQQCMEVLQGIDFKPSLGVVCNSPGKFLVHSENNGSPHCVSLEIKKEGDILVSVIKDGRHEYRLEASHLSELAEGSTDFSTIVSFQVVPKDGDGTSSCLLDLQAGSSPTASFSGDSTLFNQPNFIDSEFSSPRSSISSAIPAFMLFPQFVQERIVLFEGVCSDFLELLASQPNLWSQAPSIFSALSQTEWRTEVRSLREQLRKAASATSVMPSENVVCRIEKRLRIYISLLWSHCDIHHAPDFLDEVPNPCDGAVSKRTWERQIMLCREKLRLAKEGYDVQGGSSDEEVACLPENSWIVDEQGDVVFADVLLDSLEEEVNEYMSEILANNIRKVNRRYKCALCPFRSFPRLPQLRCHIEKYHVRKHQFVCSGTKQLKVILALHDADCAQRSRDANFLFRSALILQTQVCPPLTSKRNSIDKSIRLVFTGAGPAYANADSIGKSLLVRRVLNIYYDKDFAEILYREIVLHHSNAPWLTYIALVCCLRFSFLETVCSVENVRPAGKKYLASLASTCLGSWQLAGESVPH